LGIVATLVVVGLAVDLEGETGYWILFSIIILMMVAANTAHGAAQGLIPDLVPENRRGLYSGVKALLEVPLPVVVSLVIAACCWRILNALLVAIGLIVLAMIITMFAPEKPLQGAPPPFNITLFIRLVIMTGVFTLVILGIGLMAQQAGRLLVNAGLGVSLGVMGLIGFLSGC
jgi:hypothetical protein